MRHTWPGNAVERLHQYYGFYPNEQIATMLNSEFGMKLTAEAITQKARRESLDFRDAQGLLTLSALTRELGVNRNTVKKWAAKLGIQPKGRSRAKFFAEEDVARLREALGRPPIEVVTTDAAAVLLGVHRSTVINRIKAGKIQARRAAKFWLVPLDQLPPRYDQWGNDRLARHAQPDRPAGRYA